MGHFSGGVLLPFTLDGCVERILTDELRFHQRLPKLFWRRTDERDVDEAASDGWVHGVRHMGYIGLPLA